MISGQNKILRWLSILLRIPGLEVLVQTIYLTKIDKFLPMEFMFNDLRVLKFGGSSLDSIEKIKSIAAFIANELTEGGRYIVVVSAMGKTTNDLMNMAHKISTPPDPREYDMLLTAGERVSIALMAMALKSLNVPAVSFTGSQAGILTDGSHGNANILEIKPIRITEELKNNKVVVIAGFQGVSPQTKDVTTLGRGGTDLTAIAFSNYFSCPCCEFFKDTEGLYDKDPHLEASAKHLPEVTWKTLLAMTQEGAPFLHKQAAQMAFNHKVPLVFRHAHRPYGKSTFVRK